MPARKRLSLLLWIVYAITAPAFAADLPGVVQTAPPAYVWVETAPPVYDWTGCYLGLEGGGAEGHSQHVAATPPSPADAGLPLTNNFDMTGGLMGGTAGCNYQAGPIVFGGENDFSWINLRGSENEIPPFNPNATASTSEKWLDTMRGRVGLARDRFLVYGTAGVAFSNVGIDVCGPGVCTPVSQTQTGWVAGAGSEWAAWIGEGWSLTLKVEYLHVDLGNGVFTSPPGGTFNSRYVRLTNDIFRVGMNWKFNPWDPTMLDSIY